MTNVVVEVKFENAAFYGVVKSARTGRSLFVSAPKSDAAQARLAATCVAYYRKWNEVAA